jgi:type IV secretion system protein VirB10
MGQALLPLPVGQVQWEGGVGVDSKNDLLALKAAKEIEVLNSKMVVADFDDRVSSSIANPLGVTSQPKTSNGLSQEQAQTLANLRQKAMNWSASNPQGSLGMGSVGAGAGGGNASKMGLESDLPGAHEGALGSDKSGFQKASELLDAWSNPFQEPTLGGSTSRPSPSLANKDTLFLNEFANSTASKAGLRPRRLESAGSIFEGSVIPAVLARDIVSDLPGTLTALVSQDVYDSLTSSSVLICKGAKLVGRYNHDVRVGQSRLMFAFTRLILNSGESFDLTGFEGSDALGRAGYEGDVNNHFLKIYGSSLAIGVLADQVTKQSQVPQGTFAQPSATGQIMVQTTREILSRTRDVSPTITIEHGTPINVEVRRDLIFPSTQRARCT